MLPVTDVTLKLGQMVRDERTLLGWSRRRLAARSGVPWDVLRKIEVGYIPVLQDALDLLLVMESSVGDLQLADHLRNTEARRRLAAGEE
jgi:ribosome-binding protein aMBF1 (putative translation factor)